MKFPLMSLGVALGGALVMAASAQAASTTVTVDSHDGPWEQAANPTLEYGTLPNDNAAPASVSSGFNFAAGGSFTITYMEGTTSNGLGSSSYDANGEQDYQIGVGYHYDGSSGQPFPGDFTLTNPTYLSELIGTFANASGTVVGTPFALGDTATTVVAPSGATQLLLGINDDIFSDNGGYLKVQVDGPSAVGALPEPASWAMMIAGFGMVGATLRRRRSEVSAKA
jgi:hypothetical protein